MVSCSIEIIHVVSATLNHFARLFVQTASHAPAVLGPGFGQKLYFRQLSFSFFLSFFYFLFSILVEGMIFPVSTAFCFFLGKERTLSLNELAARTFRLGHRSFGLSVHSPALFS